MKNKRSAYMTGFICSFALAFAFIPCAVIATGGKDIPEFSDRDIMFFVIFMSCIVLAIVAAFFFAIKYNRATVSPEEREKRKQLSRQKAKENRGVFLLVASAVAITIALVVAGTSLNGASLPTKSVVPLLAVLIPVPLILAVAGRIAVIFYVKRLSSMPVADFSTFLISHRDEAEKTAAAKLKKLLHIKMASDIYAGIVGICGCAAAFLSSCVITIKPLCYLVIALSFILILSALSRIFPIKRDEFSDSHFPELTPDEYPALNALAVRAAEKIGCRKKIRIFGTIGCNAGICEERTEYSVQLGMTLLTLLSEDELYAVLLHEFAHVAPGTHLAYKVNHYAAKLGTASDDSVLLSVARQMFLLPDSIYSFEHLLYSYASSVISESNADRAMLGCGSKERVASALLKLYYSDMDEWESDTREGNNSYEHEELPHDFLRSMIAETEKHIDERRDAWNEYARAEILANNATHPTLRMRLDALGVTDYCAGDSSKSPALDSECQKAILLLEKKICDEISPTYAETRQHFYLDPLAKVEAWDEAGKPLIAEEYGDIVNALLALCRINDLMELCDRAIKELPDSAALYAYFIKGSQLLHSFDPDGIELMYHAVENNKNYIDDGMDMIGTFCCITGRKEELEHYRSRVLELAQKQHDEYDRISYIGKNDRLSAEQLPDGMLDGILAHIKAADENNIVEKIRLVRKTVSDDFFSSMFIIEFIPDADEDAVGNVMHKTFMYLDTCSDWQFSLLGYDDLDINAKKAVNAIPGTVVYYRTA